MGNGNWGFESHRHAFSDFLSDLIIERVKQNITLNDVLFNAHLASVVAHSQSLLFSRREPTAK